MKYWTSILVLSVAVLLSGCRKEEQNANTSITVFAAASTNEVLTKIAQLYEAETGVKVLLNAAASSTLARQIEAGAKADIYLSANQKWMDYLSEKDLIIPDSRKDLLSNRLVLIAPHGQGFHIDLSKDDLSACFTGRLAMGDPAHVPAGIYGQQSLESIGQWDALKYRIAPAASVSAALMLVERGETPAGIVYDSDAKSCPGVETIALFPETSHDPIVYPIAAVRGSNEQAVKFIEYLSTTKAHTLFEEYGFTPLGSVVAMTRTNPPISRGEVTSAIMLSLKVAGCCTLLLLGPCILLGWLLAKKHFPGKTILSCLVHLPLVIPPVATGYLLLVLMGSHGIIGSWLKDTFGIELAFNWLGAVLASAIVALPLMVRSIRLAFEGVDSKLEQAARTMGSSRVGAFLSVSLPLALPGVLAGCVLAFARSLGEFGATITFAGNIEGQTRTLPLAAYGYMQTPGGETTAMKLVLISVVLSMLAVAATEVLALRMRRGRTMIS